MSGDCQGRRPIYVIRVIGKIDERWTDWFGGMEIATEDGEGSPITVLTGPITDQSALRGLLTKIWDLNLVVISVLMVDHHLRAMDGIGTTEQAEGMET